MFRASISERRGEEILLRGDIMKCVMCTCKVGRQLGVHHLLRNFLDSLDGLSSRLLLDLLSNPLLLNSMYSGLNWFSSLDGQSLHLLLGLLSNRLTLNSMCSGLEWFNDIRCLRRHRSSEASEVVMGLETSSRTASTE